jgi:RNA polymerase sigma factor (TIGR02999 family)
LAQTLFDVAAAVLQEVVQGKGEGGMDSTDPHAITELLRAWSAGDKNALRHLVPLVYTNLRQLANAQIARSYPGQTLQATALVHEVYLRLADKKELVLNDRVHFYAVAAQVMRGILVDHARAQHAAKRGGGAFTIALDEAVALTDEKNIDILALDQALMRLSKLDSQHEKIVELRFFGGLSIDEISDVLQISASTVKRDWVLAKTWIRRELTRPLHDV